MDKLRLMRYTEKNPSIRDIIYALDEERQWMELVRDGGKPYSKLIDFLLSEPVHDEDTDPAVLKNMTVTSYSTRIGEKQSTVNKWLRQIYAEIFNLNDEHPERFVNPGEQICTLHYYSRTFKSGFRFKLGVKSIPRVGERVDFTFPCAITDTAVFIVRKVTHRFTHGMTEIDIELANEYRNENTYRNLLLDKARFLGLVSIEDVFAPEYELDNKLMDVFGSRSRDYI